MLAITVATATQMVKRRELCW